MDVEASRAREKLLRFRCMGIGSRYIGAVWPIAWKALHREKEDSKMSSSVPASSAQPSDQEANNKRLEADRLLKVARKCLFDDPDTAIDHLEASDSPPMHCMESPRHRNIPPLYFYPDDHRFLSFLVADVRQR